MIRPAAQTQVTITPDPGAGLLTAGQAAGVAVVASGLAFVGQLVSGLIYGVVAGVAVNLVFGRKRSRSTRRRSHRSRHGDAT